MSTVAAFVGSVPELYERHLGPVLFEPYAQDLAARIASPVQDLLEIACGTGRLTAHLLHRLLPGGRLLATDLNTDMLLEGARRVEDPRLTWAVADAGSLPYPDASFDLAACQFGVMFFPDKGAAFSEVLRVLRPGATWIFNTWDALEHNPRPAIIRQVLDRNFGAENHAFFTKGPYSYHDTGSIRDTLQAAGFTNIAHTTVAIESNFEHAEDFMTGFVEGSTLSHFLKGKDPAVQSRVRQELREEMEQLNRALGNRVPMQAHVFEAKKPGIAGS